MSWADDLQDMAGAFDEEFGVRARLTGMLVRPNRRAEPDPDRPPVEIDGVFHEGYKPMGDGRRNTDGLKETMIPSQVCTFSYETCALPWPATQGDEVALICTSRVFRVLDVRFEIASRTQLVLEDTALPRR
ncbi:MAG: hypothetical protein AB7O57_09275 [Hyphomicrobiaceae bacterium]